ncbi:MAG: hypothetical protein ACK559_03285 [bacterium]
MAHGGGFAERHQWGHHATCVACYVLLWQGRRWSLAVPSLHPDAGVQQHQCRSCGNEDAVRHFVACTQGDVLPGRCGRSG